MQNEQKAHTSGNNGHTRRVTVKQTGIEVIDKIYTLEKEADGSLFGMGHYIPDIWNCVFLDERLRPHHLAMLVMADIWFRHRPRQSRQIEGNGDVTITLSKGFSGDRYQFNRAEMASRLNTSPDAISRALTHLEKLGVIKREHEDIDINHRGFRNVVFVTPVVDKLLALVQAEQEKVNKNHPKRKTDENAQNAEPHDVGNVAPVMPVTSPLSTGQRCPDEPGDVAGITQAVSKRSSEKSSASAVFSAKPKKSLEANTNKKTSAPQGAQAGVGVEIQAWEAPPPKPSGNKGSNLDEKTKAIRFQIGRGYSIWYEEKPDISAKDFEQLLAEAITELKWRSGDFITVIQAGWLWAVDAPAKESGKSFIPGFYSKASERNLKSLFKRDRKENKLYLWHIRQELETQAQGKYETELGNMTREDADAWWEEEMLKRGVIMDESKFYDEGGGELPDPAQTTWTGINNVLESWIRFNQTERKPEQKWIEAVIERMNRDANGDVFHRSQYEAAKELLKKRGLLPESNK